MGEMIMKKFNTNLVLSIIFLASSSLTQAAITTIDFDTDPSGAVIHAPDLFSGATPLTELYADSGVHFSALERRSVTSQVPRNGVLVTVTRNELVSTSSGMGAILNDSSGFGRPAKSGANFLAFNGETDFNSHFWRISFDDPIGYFGVDRKSGVSPAHGGYVNMDAYDADGNLIGSVNNLWTRDAWSSDDWWGYRSSFKSETEISYIDIGHALYWNSGNVNAGLLSTPWAIAYDNLVFGDVGDAPAGTRSISAAVIPLPASAWFFLSGLLGFAGLRAKRWLPG